MKNTEGSKQLFEQAKRYMPGGVNSPVRAFKSVGGHPIFMSKGDGAILTDVDNNEYIDFCCSWGPLINGHNHPMIAEAAIQAVKNGTSYGTCHQGEVEISEFIISRHRFIEKIRFVSSGTEAVMSAIRLARGVTKRDKIVKFEGCYHGHADALMVSAGSGLVTFGISSSAGIAANTIADTIVVELNDHAALIQLFEHYGDQIAGVIIEPIPANNGLLLQDISFLQALRDLCTQYGAMLIFDEVISGFRTGFEGASGYYNIPADIYTFGKIIGGGFPVGAYAATASLMDHIAPLGSVYQAGTLSGNPVALAAGLAQLKICAEDGYYETLNEKTARFIQTINGRIDPSWPVHISHIYSIFWISFGLQAKIQNAGQIDKEAMNYFKEFFHLLLNEGVYFGPSGYEVGFVSSAHSEEQLDIAAAKISNALKTVFTTS